MIKLKDLIESNKTFDVFKTGLFAVDVHSRQAQQLFHHINEWVEIRFSGTGPSSGLARLLPFKIVHLQKNYKKEIVYRVENQIYPDGFPVDPRMIIRYFDENEAKNIWNKNYMTFIMEVMKDVNPSDLKYYSDREQNREFIPFSTDW